MWGNESFQMISDFSKEKREFPPVMIDNAPSWLYIKSVRILCVSLQDNLKWNEHVTQIVKKLKKDSTCLELWKNRMLILMFWELFYHYHKTRLGILLPSIWHYNIPQYLSDEIEKIQKRACRIMDPSVSYREARELTGLPLPKTRRENLCDQFFCEEP